MIRVGIIVGSTRPGRKADAVARWVYEFARQRVERRARLRDSLWTATDAMKSLPPGRPAQVDPAKLIAARQAGASLWELHQCVLAGEFAPAQPYDWRTQV